MKLRILFKGRKYHVQKKGWFFWHTLPAPENPGDEASFTNLEDAEHWYNKAVAAYTEKANQKILAQHRTVVIAQHEIRPTVPDREAMNMIEEKAEPVRPEFPNGRVKAESQE